jgi:hypothetical protein
MHSMKGDLPKCWRWPVGSLPFALFLCAVFGCSSGSAQNLNQKPVHPVRGSVTVGGAPATSAFVLFVPLNEPANAQDPRPRAEVRDDGSFAISTYGAEDGAPVGEYIVTIVWEDRDLGDKLGGRYSNSKTSMLRAQVKEGANDLPPFKL